MMPILSLHHVTATVDEAQPDLDFSVGTLGLRLVKKTVNFDNHFVYHFYYGDERGTPGTIWTNRRCTCPKGNAPSGGSSLSMAGEKSGCITSATRKSNRYENERNNDGDISLRLVASTKLFAKRRPNVWVSNL